MSTADLAGLLLDTARQAMPKHQARRLEQVLGQMQGGRAYRLGGPHRLLATPQLPPITIDRRFRPSRAKPRRPERATQLAMF